MRNAADAPVREGLDVIYVGCAGWSIPKALGDGFPPAGSHLERYAQRLPAVEINSTFYRPHRPATFARWRDAVPEGFRFAVKVPKEITHTRALSDVDEPLDRFLGEVASLDDKLGPLLVQLPPRLAFDPVVAGGFLTALRSRFTAAVVCEPRHGSWFSAAAEVLLTEFQVARVAADPAVAPAAGQPGGWPAMVYYRLHGSPQRYYSSYSEEYLDRVADALRRARAGSTAVWCIFDNTALGAATGNALALLERLQ